VFGVGLGNIGDSDIARFVAFHWSILIMRLFADNLSYILMIYQIK
jgi:hypothetical protein